ncbi:hypothetical protein [Fluviicola sp.]|uniref:hypothetical protein n=1 Tax=Fluviicola sp. TaxID=1917219 RepID=UPI0028194FC0|nr:hypothetical protein [Fluviicola sp.]MDR0800935.1 hypothetical protein [Fluviicola sp.]
MQIGMMVVVLMGTIGIPFYQHTCLSENQVYQSVFVYPRECVKEHMKETKPSCCSTPKVAVEDHRESVQGHCCVDEVSNWQFSFFFFQSVHPVFVKSFEELSVLSFFSPFEISLTDENWQLFSGADPPPALTVFERLTQLCIWRL